MFCIPIIARNVEEILEKISSAGELADLFEIRLDLTGDLDLKRIIAESRKPILATYRSISEGGKGEAEYEKITGFLMYSIASGAELVDVELSMPAEFREKIIRSKKESKVIISSHFPEKTPSEKKLKEILYESADAGADIVKIVTKANTWEDILQVLQLIPEALRSEIRIIAFCMGRIGRISRVLSLLMGGYMVFVSLDEGQESAPGQIPIQDMKRFMEYFNS